MIIKVTPAGAIYDLDILNSAIFHDDKSKEHPSFPPHSPGTVRILILKTFLYNIRYKGEIF